MTKACGGTEYTMDPTGSQIYLSSKETIFEQKKSKKFGGDPQMPENAFLG